MWWIYVLSRLSKQPKKYIYIYLQSNPLILFQLGERAATLNVAELYVSAFSNLAKTNNTVVLPANVGDAASMVAQVS